MEPETPPGRLELDEASTLLQVCALEGREGREGPRVGNAPHVAGEGGGFDATQQEF